MTSGNTLQPGTQTPETTSGNTREQRGRKPIALTDDHDQALTTPEDLAVLHGADVYEENLRRMPELKAAYRAEVDAAVKRLHRIPQAARGRLKVMTVRCPPRGCELAVVYEFPLRGGGIRWLAVGRTAAGKSKSSFLNYAFFDDWWLPDLFLSVGCRHGLAKLNRGWMGGCILAAHGATGPGETLEQMLAAVSETVRRGVRSRTWRPEPEAWFPKAVKP